MLTKQSRLYVPYYKEDDTFFDFIDNALSGVNEYDNTIHDILTLQVVYKID